MPPFFQKNPKVIKGLYRSPLLDSIQNQGYVALIQAARTLSVELFAQEAQIDFYAHFLRFSESARSLFPALLDSDEEHCGLNMLFIVNQVFMASPCVIELIDLLPELFDNLLCYAAKNPQNQAHLRELLQHTLIERPAFFMDLLQSPVARPEFKRRCHHLLSNEYWDTEIILRHGVSMRLQQHIWKKELIEQGIIGFSKGAEYQQLITMLHTQPTSQTFSTLEQEVHLHNSQWSFFSRVFKLQSDFSKRLLSFIKQSVDELDDKKCLSTAHLMHLHSMFDAYIRHERPEKKSLALIMRVQKMLSAPLFLTMMQQAFLASSMHANTRKQYLRTSVYYATLDAQDPVIDSAAMNQYIDSMYACALAQIILSHPEDAQAHYQLHQYYIKQLFAARMVWIQAIEHQQETEGAARLYCACLKAVFISLKSAAVCGHPYAQTDLSGILTRDIDPLALNPLTAQDALFNAMDNELIGLLMTREFEHDLSALRILFEIYLSGRSYAHYRSLTARLEDLYQALHYLQKIQIHDPALAEHYWQSLYGVDKPMPESLEEITPELLLEAAANELLDSPRPAPPLLYALLVQAHYVNQKGAGIYAVLLQTKEIARIAPYSPMPLDKLTMHIKERFDARAQSITGTQSSQGLGFELNDALCQNSSILFLIKNPDSQQVIAEVFKVHHEGFYRFEIHVLEPMNITIATTSALHLSLRGANNVHLLATAPSENLVIEAHLPLLTIDRTLEVRNNLLIHISDTLHLPQSTRIQAKTASLKARIMKCEGQTHIEEHCTLDVLLLECRTLSQWNVGAHLHIQANALIEFKGQLSAATMKLSVVSLVNFSGDAQIIATQRIEAQMEALLLFDNAQIRAKEIQCRVEKKGFIQTDARIQGDTLNLYGLSDSSMFNIYGSIQAHQLNVHTPGALLFHLQSKLNAQQLHIEANSLSNAGQWTIQQGTLRIDGVFTHGFNSWADARDMLRQHHEHHEKKHDLRMPLIDCSGTLTCVSLVRAQFGGIIKAGTSSSASLLDLGIYAQASNTNICSALLSFRAGIDVPDLPKIFNLLMECSTLLQKGEYKKALSELFSEQAFTRGARMASWLMRFIAPGVAIPFTMITNILISIAQAPPMSRHVLMLMKKPKLTRVDILQLAVLFKDLAFSASTLPHLIEGLAHLEQVVSFSAPLEALDASDFLYTGIAVFAPISLCTSVLDVGSGVKLMPVQSSLSLAALRYDVAAGISLSTNAQYEGVYGGLALTQNSSTSGTYINDYRTLAAHEVTVLGTHYHHEGALYIHNARIHANEHLTLFGSISSEGKAQIDGARVDISAHETVRSGTLAISASTEIHMSKTNRASGQGALYVAAPTGHIDGLVNTATLVLALDDLDSAAVQNLLTDSNADIHPSEQLEIVTKQYMHWGSLKRNSGALASVSAPGLSLSDIDSQADLILRATSGDIDIQAQNLHADASLFLEAQEGAIHADAAHLSAVNVLSMRAKDCVSLTKAPMISADFVQIHAGETLSLAADEITGLGLYHDQKNWRPGMILGGSGQEHDGIGVALSAKRIEVDTSIISAEGAVHLGAEEEVSVHGRYNLYLQALKTHNAWLGFGRCTTEYSYGVQIGAAALESKTAKVAIYVQEGPARLLETHISAQEGIDVSAKGAISFDGYVVPVLHVIEQSTLLGLCSYEHREIQEYALPTQVQTPSDVKIISADEVDLSNVEMLVEGQMSVQAPHLNISAPLLHQHITQTQSGLSLSSPILSNCSPAQILMQPALVVQQITGANDGLGRALGIANALVDTAHSVDTLSKVMRSADMTAATIALLPPLLRLGWSHVTQQVSRESVAPNRFKIGQLELRVSQDINIKGVVIDVGSAHIQASDLNLDGQALSCDAKTQRIGISASWSLSSGLSAQAQTQSSALHQITYAMAQINAIDSLELHLDTLRVSAGQIHAARLIGAIEQLDLKSILSESQRHQAGIGLSTTGQIDAHKEQAEQSVLTDRSGIFVQEGFNSEDNPLLIKGIYSVAGVIATQGSNRLAPHQWENQALEGRSTDSSLGLSFNIGIDPSQTQALVSVLCHEGSRMLRYDSAALIGADSPQITHTGVLSGSIDPVVLSLRFVNHNARIPLHPYEVFMQLQAQLRTISHRAAFVVDHSQQGISPPKHKARHHAVKTHTTQTRHGFFSPHGMTHSKRQADNNPGCAIKKQPLVSAKEKPNEKDPLEKAGLYVDGLKEGIGCTIQKLLHEGLDAHPNTNGAIIYFGGKICLALKAGSRILLVYDSAKIAEEMAAQSNAKKRCEVFVIKGGKLVVEVISGSAAFLLIEATAPVLSTPLAIPSSIFTAIKMGERWEEGMKRCFQ